MNTCTVDRCGRPARCRGYCDLHYQRLRKGHDLLAEPRYQRRRAARICTVEACGKPHYALGYCQVHYRRWCKYGDPGGAGPVALQRINRSGFTGVFWRADQGKRRAQVGQGGKLFYAGCFATVAEAAAARAALAQQLEGEHR
jgi:hypothetical protein